MLNRPTLYIAKFPPLPRSERLPEHFVLNQFLDPWRRHALALELLRLHEGWAGWYRSLAPDDASPGALHQLFAESGRSPLLVPLSADVALDDGRQWGLNLFASPRDVGLLFDASVMSDVAWCVLARADREVLIAWFAMVAMACEELWDGPTWMAGTIRFMKAPQPVETALARGLGPARGVPAAGGDVRRPGVVAHGHRVREPSPVGVGPSARAVAGDLERRRHAPVGDDGIPAAKRRWRGGPARPRTGPAARAPRWLRRRGTGRRRGATSLYRFVLTNRVGGVRSVNQTPGRMYEAYVVDTLRRLSPRHAVLGDAELAAALGDGSRCDAVVARHGHYVCVEASIQTLRRKVADGDAESILDMCNRYHAKARQADAVVARLSTVVEAFGLRARSTSGATCFPATRSTMPRPPRS